MVDGCLKKVETPFSGGIGRQRRWGLSTFAKTFRVTAIPLSGEKFVLAAKTVGADLLELAAPEIEEVVSGTKTFQTAAESVGRRTLRKNLGGGSRKNTASRVIPANLRKKPVGCEESFSQTFLINHVEQFSVTNFWRQFLEISKEISL